MNALTLKNTWKNLTLIAAGAVMATMIAVPLAGIASADDEPYIAPVETAVYTITASNGLTSSFQLVERDGDMFLVLVVPEEASFPFDDDDDE